MIVIRNVEPIPHTWSAATELQEVVKRVQPLLLEPDFTYAVMKTKSAAAANLCNWVINIINFNQVSSVPPTLSYW